MSIVGQHQQHLLQQASRPLWGGYVNMLKTLESVFQSPKHWILEFLQNAEDASSSKFAIRLDDTSIQVLNDGQNPLGESAIKVSIFMSIFSVHVNRVPIRGRISKIDYHPGKFFSANLDKASEQNENNRITLQTDQGHKIVFIQIAGLVARRIVCWIKAGDRVGSGQRCGLIRFGSRLDVYIPKGTRLLGKMHQKVKAGETKLGYLT